MFTLIRNGSFKCRLIPGTPHCGLKEPVNTFRYEVRLVSNDEALDNEGFLVDNQIIQNFFDDIKITGKSCELLARDAARHFYRLVANSKPNGGNAKNIREIGVKIWGTPEAFVEYMWTAGEGKFPVEKAPKVPTLEKKVRKVAA